MEHKGAKQLILSKELQNLAYYKLTCMATTSCEDYHKRLFREYKDK